MSRPPARIKVFLALLLSTLSSGCHLILGLDEYSLQESCLPAECGVYVSADGSDINEGTKETPVRTIAKAVEIARSGNNVIYACAQEFVEAVSLPSGIILKGGFDCFGGWEHIGELARTTISAGPNAIPLRLTGGAGVTRIEDIHVKAADATLQGGSSIAAIIEGAKAEIFRCHFSAGSGTAGAKGETPNEFLGPSDWKDPMIRGSNGANACLGDVSGNPGGLGTANPLCAEAMGGDGGNGAVPGGTGGNGTDGAPHSASGTGKGGSGDTGAGCEAGDHGEDGAWGAPGAGGLVHGRIDAGGYAGAVGKQGGRGAHGQAGGGGLDKVGCNGASGGGGGGGGCGGYGGTGGLPGGSSIAIINLNSDLAFTDVTLSTASGGAGGEGGDGQNGGTGGLGGAMGVPVPATTWGCRGGSGGWGGAGGKGGGGRGGHSIGVAFTGVAPPAPSKVMLGAPGQGGLGSDAITSGAPGEAKDMLEFLAAP